MICCSICECVTRHNFTTAEHNINVLNEISVFITTAEIRDLKKMLKRLELNDAAVPVIRVTSWMSG